MAPALRGELLFNEPLSDYTSWHVGGYARQFYKPADIADLCQFLSSLSVSENIVWLGLGSNVLIRDGGINGTVIFTQGRLAGLSQLDKGIIRAEAGITCAKLAKYCARSQFNQGTFFAGIPGTVGGSLAMNAGAFGGVTWSHVVAVETVDQQGKLYVRNKDEFIVNYREVKKPFPEWFVAGHFRFPVGDQQTAETAIRELLRKRANSQPIGEFSCGSVFRNPPNDYAGRLIENCGLKGKTIGGAWVSQKHANFIINGGSASAADIEALIYFVQREVMQQHGVHLIPECHIIGEI
jgi:UDP-N-acetylmuramate dehydrogenase